MPIHEYACKQCDRRFETLVRNAERPECPSCHSRELERQLSVFAAHTTGAGAAPKAFASGACRSCGDPRGPGACSMN